MSNETLMKVWSDFMSSEDSNIKKEAKKKLIEHYFPLVKKVAQRQILRLADAADIDDLVSTGVNGLYDAVDNFDPKRKTKFETYAMHRIRGSMLDAIRTNDWVPRLVRQKFNMIEKGRHYHECEVGHKLTHTELADKMHMETNEFEDLATEAYIPVIHSINYLARKDEDNDVSVETIKDVKSKQPVEKILRNEFFSKLLGKGFTPQERQIIWLYYYEERSMKDISAMLDLSESMVSQMHYKIMKRLRNKCERNPEYFADIQSLFKV